MIFDLIRFPGYILSEHLKASSERGQTSSIDLSSFNLNLGDFGSARLVASLTPGQTVDQSIISVILSNVDGEDSSLSISCSLLVVNEHGEEISKVFPYTYLAERYHSNHLSQSCCKANNPPVPAAAQAFSSQWP